MEKIVLKDGTEYELAEGSSLKKLRLRLATMTDVAEALQKFTTENLADFEIVVDEIRTAYHGYMLDSIGTPVGGVCLFTLKTVEDQTIAELQEELARTKASAAAAQRAAADAQAAEKVAEDKYAEANEQAVTEKARADAATARANTYTEKYEQAKADLEEAEETIVEKDNEIIGMRDRAEAAEEAAREAQAEAAANADAAEAVKILLGEEA